MRSGPSDSLIAYKTINLADDLSATEKRVAAALLDHHNRQTGRCDPSIDTISKLLSVHRRTIIRAISALAQKGVFRVHRHGGYGHRNQYEPIWGRFRANETSWKKRRQNVKADRSLERKLSPLQRQECHVDGDTGATQTCLINQSNLTSARQQQSQQPSSWKVETSVKRPPKVGERKPTCANVDERFHGKQSLSEIARIAAERRWNVALTRQLATAPAIFADVIEAIDTSLSTATTDIELRRPGSGIAFLLSELGRRIPLSMMKERE